VDRLLARLTAFLGVLFILTPLFTSGSQIESVVASTIGGTLLFMGLSFLELHERLDRLEEFDQ
jgi:hypothetical protein